MGKNNIYRLVEKGMKEIKKNIEHAIVIMAFSRGRFRYYMPGDMKIIKMYIIEAHKKPRAASKREKQSNSISHTDKNI
jgi:hypothetical protein